MARSKTDAKRINIYIPNGLLDITKRYAERHGISTSEVIRSALKKYLREELNIEVKPGKKVAK